VLLFVVERADNARGLPGHEAKADLFDCNASTIRSVNTAPNGSSRFSTNSLKASGITVN
jgi:hypothetical protein